MSEVKSVVKAKKQELVLEGDPEAQFEFAQKAAKTLMKRVNAKEKKIVIQGKQYLEFGDWQTLARFFGATVGVEWTKPIERAGKLLGYEARAVVYQHGETISAAEASCLRDEKNWKHSDEYAVKSMAQTRASAKALRNAFGWVAELAGYASTPAEEMPRENTFNNDSVKMATDKQIEIIYQVVTRLTDYEQQDEIEEWLEGHVGAKTSQMSTKAASAVIGKLFAAEKEQKNRAMSQSNDDVVVELTEEEVKNGIDLDKLPY